MTDPGPRVTLLRHGETEWSRSGQHTSRTDLPLTDTGREGAFAAGSRLAGASFAAVFVSPLQRARQTAELAGLTPYEIDADLHEWDYGELEGRTTPDIRQDLPGWSVWTGPWLGGEDAAAVGARADRVIARLLAWPPGSSLAVVGHGHFLRVLAARWLGTAVADGRWFILGTATLSRLGWENADRAIELWNAPVVG